MGAAGSISNAEYFGPPSEMLVSASISDAGISHRRPSPASANRHSNRDGSNYFATPDQLWFPPFVAM